MNLLRAVLRAIDWLSLWSGRIVAWLVPVMVVALTYEVVSRYFFHAPTLWAQDTAIFCFGYVGLVGGAYVARERAHINVDLVYQYLRPRLKAFFDLISGLIALFFVALVVYYGWHEMERVFSLGQRRPTDWAPPLGPFVAAIAVGGGLLFLQLLATWVRNFFLVATGRYLDDGLKPVDSVTGQPVS